MLTKKYFESIGVPVHSFHSFGASEAKVPDLMDVVVAVHERRGDECGKTLARASQGPGGKHSRNCAAAGDPPRNNVGHDRAAVQAKCAENAVEHIGHSSKVPRILKKCDCKEHEQYQRHKPEDPAHSVDQPRDDQRLERPGRQRRVRESSQGRKACYQPSLGRLAVGECEPIDSVNYQHHEDGAEKTIGEHPVELIGEIEPVGFVASA